MEEQVKSKKRVADHGEVFTAEREVNAMLDLVKQETERIESRFLEPACGTGNFLVEILRRKLAVAKRKYKRSPADYERMSFIAVTSIYGVELLQDNVDECRERLFEIWDGEYKAVCKKDCSDECRKAVRYVLSKNILCGNALTLLRVDENGEDIRNEPNKPFLGEPNSVCTETYLVIGPFAHKNYAENVISYISTRLFRFLVLLLKNTQHATKSVYKLVPMQDFSKPWTDEELYAKYGLTEEEISFIESMIKPMELGGDNNG